MLLILFYLCFVIIYTYSHLTFRLDIILIIYIYIDLMYSVIKHVITVGLGNIKTNNKGKELNSLIINNTTYIYNKQHTTYTNIKTYII